MQEPTREVIKEIKENAEGAARAIMESGKGVFLPANHGLSIGDSVEVEQALSKAGNAYYKLKQPPKPKWSGGGGGGKPWVPTPKANEASIASQTLVKAVAEVYGKLIPPFSSAESVAFNHAQWAEIESAVLATYATFYKALAPTHNATPAQGAT